MKGRFNRENAAAQQSSLRKELEKISYQIHKNVNQMDVENVEILTDIAEKTNHIVNRIELVRQSLDTISFE